MLRPGKGISALVESRDPRAAAGAPSGAPILRGRPSAPERHAPARCVLTPHPHHRYDSWTGVQGHQTASEAHAQVQSEEAALSPQQKQQLAQLKQQQQQRKLMQGPKTQAQVQEIHDIDQGACRRAGSRSWSHF